MMVDKYMVCEYIKQTIGEKYLIPLVGGLYYSIDDIDLEPLPEQFVLLISLYFTIVQALIFIGTKRY